MSALRLTCFLLLALASALLGACGGEDDQARVRFDKKDAVPGADAQVDAAGDGLGEGLTDWARPDGGGEGVAPDLPPREGTWPDPDPSPGEGSAPSWEPWPEPDPEGSVEHPPEPWPEPTWEPLPEPAWEPRPEPTPEVVEALGEVAPTLVTIHELQTSAESLGCQGDPFVARAHVRLAGVVVTAPRFTASYTGEGLDGYYVADGSSAAMYRGLLLVVPAPLGTDFPVGAPLDVVGDHKEFYCMTEVFASAVTQVGAASTPQPLAVSGAQVAWADPDSEPLEGTLVRLSGGTITALDDFGEVVVDDLWRLANEFDLPYLQAEGGRAVGDTIVSATGVFEYSFGKYLVNPRGPQDLVVQTP